MRSPLPFLLVAVSLVGVAKAGSAFEAGRGGSEVVRRSDVGGGGGSGSVADHLLLSRQFGNRFRNGNNRNSGGGGGGAGQGGDIANNGTVVNQPQRGDAATAAGSGNAADGQGQQNITAATGADNNNNADGNAGDNNDNATAGGQQGNPPPAEIVDTGDPQKNLFLDPSQVAKGLALDGQQVPAANPVASATSVNNFINSCLLRTDLPLTNGNQVITGSCNAVPMGIIAAQNKAPSSKFTNPKNLDVIPPDQTFTITMAINNLVTGNFVNAQQNYFSAPQATDNNGIIIGHSHVVVEQIDSLQSTAVTNPQEFAFFKGFNEAAQNGVLSATVDGGLPAGVYKMSSINSASNHQPALVGVAQHGSLDDAVYFIASNDPDALATALNIQGNNNAAAGAAAGGGAANNGTAGAGAGAGGQQSLSSSAAADGQGTTSAAIVGGGGGAGAGAQTTTTSAAAAATSTTAAAGDAGAAGGGRGGVGGGRGGGGFFGGGGRGGGGNNRFSRSRNGNGGGRNNRRSDDGAEGLSLLERRLAALMDQERRRA